MPFYDMLFRVAEGTSVALILTAIKELAAMPEERQICYAGY